MFPRSNASANVCSDAKPHNVPYENTNQAPYFCTHVGSDQRPNQSSYIGTDSSSNVRPYQSSFLISYQGSDVISNESPNQRTDTCSYESAGQTATQRTSSLYQRDHAQPQEG
jgi:hypothetical protein